MEMERWRDGEMERWRDGDMETWRHGETGKHTERNDYFKMDPIL